MLQLCKIGDLRYTLVLMGDSELQTQWQIFFDSRAGKALLSSEAKLLDPLLASLHGACLLQIGGPDDPKLIAKSPILHKIHLAKALNDKGLQPDLYGQFDRIPLASKSVDVAILYHSLELENNPQFVINEVHRILKGEGTVIILSLHSFSLWGIQHLWKKSNSPWNGRFFSTFKLQRLLAKAGFIDEKHKTVHFKPYLHNKNSSNKWQLLELVGQLCWPFCGAVSIIKAKKRLHAMTPLEQELYESELDPDSTLPEPTTRHS